MAVSNVNSGNILHKLTLTLKCSDGHLNCYQLVSLNFAIQVGMSLSIPGYQSNLLHFDWIEVDYVAIADDWCLHLCIDQVTDLSKTEAAPELEKFGWTTAKTVDIDAPNA